MRQVLICEQSKEFHNAAALGLFNSAVGKGDSGKIHLYQRSLREQFQALSPKEVQDTIHSIARNIRDYESSIKDKKYSAERKKSFKVQLNAEKKRMDLLNSIHFPGIRKEKIKKPFENTPKEGKFQFENIGGIIYRRDNKTGIVSKQGKAPKFKLP